MIQHRNQELERAVVGTCLLITGAFDVALTIIRQPEVFTDPDYRAAWETMRRMHAQGKGIDIMTVADTMSKSGRPDVAKLMDATMSISSDANLEHHSRILAQHYVARGLKSVCDRISLQVDDEPDAFKALEFAEALIFNLPGDIRTGQFITAADAITSSFKRMEEIRARPAGAAVGVTTGLAALNTRWGGLQPPNLIVIAARPGMGKTSLMLNMARAQVEAGIAVVVFSLEMSAEQLINRLVCDVANIPGDVVLDPRKMSSDEVRRYTDAAEKISGWPLYIDDTPGVSVETIRSMSRKLKREKGLGAVYLDYIQLATATVEKGGNREQVVSAIARGLKGLAKELDVPVVALSQLSRAVETRADKIPQLSDLRESGAIEQDADQVAFIYRAEYYGIMEDEAGTSTRGLAEIITAKNRFGGVGTDVVRWEGPRTRFFDLEEVPEPTFADVWNPAISQRPSVDDETPF